jgi:toxin ParE1/3/4
LIEKPLVSRAVADRDVDDVVDHYTDIAGDDIALRFVRELAAAKRMIVEAPRLGSPRYAEKLSTPNLRHRKVRRFPHLVFYIEFDDRIEIVRVLHAARDIPAWLIQPDGGD